MMSRDDLWPEQKDTAMSEQTSEQTVRQILYQLDNDYHDYHNGRWDFSGPKPVDKAESAINAHIVSVLEGLKVKVKPHDGNDMVADIIADAIAEYKQRDNLKTKEVK